jgi:hypothetical protein
MCAAPRLQQGTEAEGVSRPDVVKQIDATCAGCVKELPTPVQKKKNYRHVVLGEIRTRTRVLLL